MQIIKMEREHRGEVLPMVRLFYQSDAVDHPVDDEVLIRSFEAAVTEESLLEGVVLCEEGEAVGFAYLTKCYSCEVGGEMLILEELFMKEDCRGKGYGKKFFAWLFETFKEVKRFRLEVTEVNEGAVRLYEKLGFSFLDYGQMICDK